MVTDSKKRSLRLFKPTEHEWHVWFLRLVASFFEQLLLKHLVSDNAFPVLQIEWICLPAYVTLLHYDLLHETTKRQHCVTYITWMCKSKVRVPVITWKWSCDHTHKFWIPKWWNFNGQSWALRTKVCVSDILKHKLDFLPPFMQ